jgi:single-strand DNA-binding protein
VAKGTINKVFLVGNIGQDPEIYHLDKCDYAIISMATMAQWNDKLTNLKHIRTEWHRIIVYGKLVAAVEKYIHKGDKVGFVGRLQTRKWADQAGIEKSMIEIIGEEFQLLASKNINIGFNVDEEVNADHKHIHDNL